MDLEQSKKIPEEFKELAKDFSEKGFNSMWDFAEGSKFWNFVRGRGRSGKAHPGRMKGASRN